MKDRGFQEGGHQTSSWVKNESKSSLQQKIIYVYISKKIHEQNSLMSNISPLAMLVVKQEQFLYLETILQQEHKSVHHTRD